MFKALYWKKLFLEIHDNVSCSWNIAENVLETFSVRKWRGGHKSMSIETGVCGSV